MNVYIAFRGKFGDRHCVGVFTTEEVARKMAEDYDVEKQELRDNMPYIPPGCHERSYPGSHQSKESCPCRDTMYVGPLHNDACSCDDPLYLGPHARGCSRVDPK